MTTTPAAAPRASSGHWGQALGYAGLLPFVAAVVAAGWAPPAWRGQALSALAAYGAVITSFLGGVHWGVAFMVPERATHRFGWGVVPSVLAWAALLLPLAWSLALLAALLVACLAVDRRVYPKYRLEQWLPLRWRLTVVAVACLCVGALLA